MRVSEYVRKKILKVWNEKKYYFIIIIFHWSKEFNFIGEKKENKNKKHNSYKTTIYKNKKQDIKNEREKEKESVVSTRKQFETLRVCMCVSSERNSLNTMDWMIKFKK